MPTTPQQIQPFARLDVGRREHQQQLPLVGRDQGLAVHAAAAPPASARNVLRSARRTPTSCSVPQPAELLAALVETPRINRTTTGSSCRRPASARRSDTGGAGRDAHARSAGCIAENGGIGEPAVHVVAPVALIRSSGHRRAAATLCSGPASPRYRRAPWPGCRRAGRACAAARPEPARPCRRRAAADARPGGTGGRARRRESRSAPGQRAQHLRRRLAAAPCSSRTT